MNGVPVARQSRGTARPQAGKSTFPHQKPECESVRVFTFYLLPIHYYLMRIRIFGKVISKKEPISQIRFKEEVVYEPNASFWKL